MRACAGGRNHPGHCANPRSKDAVTHTATEMEGSRDCQICILVAANPIRETLSLPILFCRTWVLSWTPFPPSFNSCSLSIQSDNAMLRPQPSPRPPPRWFISVSSTSAAAARRRVRRTSTLLNIAWRVWQLWQLRVNGKFARLVPLCHSDAAVTLIRQASCKNVSATASAMRGKQMPLLISVIR